MTDLLGRIATLEGELEAARARLAHLEAIKKAARRYLLGDGQTVVEAGLELHQLFKGGA